MMRWILIGLAAIAAAIALFVFKAESFTLSYLASKTEQMTLAQRRALIESDFEIHLPENAQGPAPTVILFHGCAGPRMSFQRDWAKRMNEAGYAAIITDSTGPRGFSRQEALATVCRGQALIGQERAGDVLAAIDWASNDERFDTGRLVLAGWSHGAWSIMDFLTMDMDNASPAGITDVQPPAPDIRGAILFYPHCGPGALAPKRGWVQDPEALAFIAGADTIVDAEKCINYFENRKRDKGGVSLTVYPGAEHAFDDSHLEPEWIHWYNEEYALDAARQVKEFLERLQN
ncbi:MAG: dienelactone hydrolase family protein [Pseudomonadota bacterium]